MRETKGDEGVSTIGSPIVIVLIYTYSTHGTKLPSNLIFDAELGDAEQ